MAAGVYLLYYEVSSSVPISSRAGNAHKLATQAPLTCCNLRRDPCVGSSEPERTGISLARIPHVCQSYISSLVNLFFPTFIAFGFFFLPLLFLCSFAHVLICMYSTHAGSFTGTNQTRPCRIFSSDLHRGSEASLLQRLGSDQSLL